MVPSAVVVLERFPLTPNGKLDRQALPAPDLAAVVTRPYEAPQGTIEVTLAEIWQELLGVAQVGRHDTSLNSGALPAGSDLDRAATPARPDRRCAYGVHCTYA